MSEKIINTFQQRRQLNEAITSLAETTTQTDLRTQVQEIIQTYDPDLVIPALLKQLDTPSSQLRGGLGQLAILLPQDQIVPALRNTVANRNNPTQSRLTAALILDRFLQAEISPALLSDLQDPQEVVMQSLQEAVEEGRENRHILLEYVRQMRQENESVAFMVMDLLGQLPAADRLDLLRLIAYDARSGVARKAIQHLAQMRQGEAAEQAAEALHTLQFSLPPDLAQEAERSLRKLKFSGVDYTPPGPAGWRALLSPANRRGTQDLWFIRTQEADPHGTLIGLRINANDGVQETFGSEAIEKQYLPPDKPIGQMFSISMTSGTATVFLEVPFDYARWQLQNTLDSHWQQANPRPLPDEYALYNAAIWSFAAPEVDPALQTLLASGPDLWEKKEWDVEIVSAELLHHPAMSGWIFQNRQMADRVQEMAAKPDQFDVTAIVKSVLQETFVQNDNVTDEEVADGLREGLLAQAGWLAIADQEEDARRALFVAESLQHIPPLRHPLLRLMMEMGVVLLYRRQQEQ